MLLSFKEGILDSRGYTKFAYPKFDVYLSGLIFIRKLKAGKETLDFIAQYLEKNGNIPFSKLSGKFAAIIDFHDEDRQIAFTDNSSMHGMFITKSSLGSNMLELAKHDGLNCFDEVGLCEYLSMFRCGFSGNTIISGITLANNMNYYEIKSGKCREFSKQIDDIQGKSSIDDPFEFFRDISYALSDMKSICALTGGCDSRMVASIMNTFKSYECFISGDNDNSSDINVAMKTAEAGGFKMRLIRPILQNPDDEKILEAFRKGSVLGFDARALRIKYFFNALADDGFNVIIDGNAGGMHKEFWLIQELPFYWRKRTDVTKFYYLRCRSFSKYCGEFVTPRLKYIDELNMKIMKTFTKDRNSRSCFCFGWKMDNTTSALNNMEQTCPISYSPLQEIDLVRNSYSMLPKGMRMNLFMRHLTTRANRKAARIPTIYGTTSSDEFLYMVRDFFMQNILYCQKALKYIARRFFNKKIFVDKVNSTATDNELRKLKVAVKVVEWGKSRGYLNDKATVEVLPIDMLNKIMNLFLFAQELGIE